MATPFIGQIVRFALDWQGMVFVGWIVCDGRMLDASEGTYGSLFSLIGFTYGGDGQQQFAVPDFRGRAPVGVGQVPNRMIYPLCQAGGSEQVKLTGPQYPNHT